MSGQALTVTEVARHFSDYVNRVTYRNESFVLLKGKKAVAELRPLPQGRRLGDLPSILQAAPRLSDSEAKAFACDLDEARASLGSIEERDPWAS